MNTIHLEITMLVCEVVQVIVCYHLDKASFLNSINVLVENIELLFFLFMSLFLGQL